MQFGPNKATNQDTLISNLILGYYVKYTRLKQLIDFTFSGSNATEIDIYIDLRDIMYRVGKHLLTTQLPINNPLIFTSGIINMVAHYRQFFASRYNCTSRFFIIDSIDDILACKYCSEFKLPSVSENMKTIYNLNMQFLPMLCQYINDVQYIQTTTNIVVKSISIHDIESSRGKRNPSIIISKDSYTLQASAHDDFYVLIPKKNNSGDVSILSNKGTAIGDYVYIISRGNHDLSKWFSADFLPIFMAMTRVPSKALGNIMNIGSALKHLQLIRMTPNISYYPSDMHMFLKYLLEGSAYSKYESRILYRYQACDAINMQYMGYKLMPEYQLYNGILNLYDPNSIKMINNEHFKDCPLDLNVL